MTRGGWLLIGALALGAAPAQAQTSANAPAPYEDRIIEGLAPLADENDGQNDYDRGGWPRYLRLETRLGAASGIALTSLLFGAAHLIAWQGPWTLVYAWAVAASGLVLSLLRHVSGRLGAPMAAHAFFNAQVMAIVVLLT